MIRALIAGRKTQTRRVVKGAPTPAGDYEGHLLRGEACFGIRGRVGTSSETFNFTHGEEGERPSIRCPYGAPGDLLYVRETWKPHSTFAGMKPRDIPRMKVFYKADDTYAPSNTPWVPAIHQPRWASRLTLEVTEVRVERLQDISEADAIAEGVRLMRDGGGVFVGREGPGKIVTPWPTAVEAYSDIWNGINGSGSWDANPWVWAVSFKLLEIANG